MNECSHDSNRLCCVALTLLDFVRPIKCFNHISAVLDKVLEFIDIEKNFTQVPDIANM